MEVKDTHIYVLKDPATKEVRYVGKTIMSPKERLWSHIAHCGDGNTHKDKWLCMLLKNGLYPEIEVIDTVRENWEDAERFYISHFKSCGADLCNHTVGGDGTYGWKHTDEWKQKMSERLKNNPIKRDPEKMRKYGEKMSLYLKTHPDKCYFNRMTKNERKIAVKLANAASVAKSKKTVFELDENKSVIKTYGSVSEVAREFNCDSSIISGICRKNTNGGIRLKYKGRCFAYNVNNKQFIARHDNGKKTPIRVTNTITGKSVDYKTKIDYTKFLGIRESGINYYIKNNRLYRKIYKIEKI